MVGSKRSSKDMSFTESVFGQTFADELYTSIDMTHSTPKSLTPTELRRTVLSALTDYLDGSKPLYKLDRSTLAEILTQAFGEEITLDKDPHAKAHIDSALDPRRNAGLQLEVLSWAMNNCKSIAADCNETRLREFWEADDSKRLPGHKPRTYGHAFWAKHHGLRTLKNTGSIKPSEFDRLTVEALKNLYKSWQNLKR